MIEGIAFVSKGEGRVRLDYSANGISVVKLWEAKGKRILETVFDENGAVLQQQLLNMKDSGLEAMIEHELRSIPAKEVKDRPYEDVKLKKPCPGCGSASLERCDRSVSGDELPVVPMYVCKSCGKKSYHLTAKYLEYLISRNKGLFEQDELAKMGDNHGAFVNELEEYILRIFASKKVMRIR
jgi:predicted RNA-binding Zn-ribbon protein involved in translation (DUF1610 family)